MPEPDAARPAAPDELHGHYIEDLEVGMSACLSRTVTEADVVLFAGISGDTNPIHLSQEFAAGSVFKGRVAHGMLTAGLISGVLGSRLPGPGAIYLSQNLAFKAPVKIGDTVTVRATVTDINRERRRVTMKTVCSVGGTVVIDGEALLLVPRKG
jgi:3-hydroxybutyryl-CoA dehydratase